MAITRRDGKVEFEGAVLSTYTSSRFVMSDYGVPLIARVWNGRAVVETGLGCIDIGEVDACAVDATPEVLATVKAWEADQAARRSAERTAEALLADWLAVKKGSAVVVVKGRKVAKGTRGVVAWIGSNAYGTSAGLAIEGVTGLTFTALSNLKRDHSDDSASREMDAAQASATWYDANVAAPKATILSAGIEKGSKVTPKAGRYAGKLCRVIWAGVRDGAARVGVVPATKGRFDADWLNLAEVA